MAEREMELDLSEETFEMIRAYGQKTHRTEEQVVESILQEFLSNQYHVIEKRAKEVNEPVDKLVNMQVARIAEYLNGIN